MYWEPLISTIEGEKKGGERAAAGPRGNPKEFAKNFHV